MSEQNVTSFLNKANTDTVLQGKIKALTANNLSDLIALATHEGLPFTAPEWEAVKATSFGDEMDEEALDQVAGGGGGVAGIQCDEKPTGFVTCNGKPLFNSQSLFQTFGK